MFCSGSEDLWASVVTSLEQHSEKEEEDAGENVLMKD